MPSIDGSVKSGAMLDTGTGVFISGGSVGSGIASAAEIAVDTGAAVGSGVEPTDGVSTSAVGCAPAKPGAVGSGITSAAEVTVDAVATVGSGVEPTDGVSSSTVGCAAAKPGAVGSGELSPHAAVKAKTAVIKLITIGTRLLRSIFVPISTRRPNRRLLIEYVEKRSHIDCAFQRILAIRCDRRKSGCTLIYEVMLFKVSSAAFNASSM